MIVEVLTGPPGCGKSTTMRQEAINRPGRYLFAFKTLALLSEQVAAMSAEARHVPLREAHSDREKKVGTVQRQLDDAAQDLAGEAHAFVMTTHESLMARDLSDFVDWHIRIDEAPDAVGAGRLNINTANTRAFLEENYVLSPMPSGWSKVTPTGKEYNWRKAKGDVLYANLSAFSNQAHRVTGVFVDTDVWKTKATQWLSVWVPDLLDQIAPASVQIAGATFMTSVGGLVARKWGTAKIIERHLPMIRTQQPLIRIHYFTEGHEGTTDLWQGHEGRRFIVAACDWLAKNVPNLGFWSGNKVVEQLMDWRVPGGPIPPKIAGLNQYRDCESCAFIYSAKPGLDDSAVQSEFDITTGEMRAAREDEDILQFVMRGALRKPDYSGAYDIYLYNKRQAETLADQLTLGGFDHVELGAIDAGFADAKLSKAAATRPPPQSKEPVLGVSGKLINPKSAKRRAQRHAKNGGPQKRGRKAKTPPLP